MDTITKTKADTYLITKTTSETISLKDLETDLANKVAYNKTIDDLELSLKDVPENLKQFIQIPLKLFIDQKDVEFIKQLKTING